MTDTARIESVAHDVRRAEHRVHQGRGMEAKLRALGASLRNLRGERSQGRIAKQVGISTQQYSNIECGNNWPSMPVYMKLCRLHGVKVPLL